VLKSGYWVVESRLHRCLDITLREDESRVRPPKAARGLGTIRRVIVSQNGATTKLYRNVGARSGLRVRLVGAGADGNGIGAVVRLGTGGRWGPARAVHAGGGYWSQDSAVLVLASPNSPSHLWVRWPGSKTNVAELPASAQEV
jgi:hypothetical protein